MLIYLIVISMHNPITIIIHATGKIRNYHLLTETFTILSLPLSWTFYGMGLPPESLFAAMLLVCTLAHIARVYCIKKTFALFSIKSYLCEFLLPALLLSVSSYMVFMKLDEAVSEYWLNLAIVFLGVPSFMCILCYIIGLSKNERCFIKQFVKSIIKKNV